MSSEHLESLGRGFMTASIRWFDGPDGNQAKFWLLRPREGIQDVFILEETPPEQATTDYRGTALGVRRGSTYGSVDEAVGFLKSQGYEEP